MYAVIKSGGKQYKVTINDIIRLEKLEGTKGDTIVIDDVLMFVDEKGKVTLGSPLVPNYKVAAEVLDQAKGDKVLVFKKKRRHNYRRKRGHRQEHTWVKITDIGQDIKPKKSTAKPKAEEKAEAKPAAEKKAEAKKPAAKKEAAKPATAEKKAAPKKAEASKPKKDSTKSA